MTNRRSFVSSMLGAGLALPVLNSRAIRRLEDATRVAGARSASSLATDEDYWGEIRRAFDLDGTVINLNNGGCSPAPTHVLAQMIRDLQFSNELPVEHMWQVLEPRIESVRTDLAHEFGCDAEEMAITRNASESNLNVIFGLDLQPGDEVISTTQNYPRMVNGWLQRQRRNKIVFKQIKLPTPPPSDDEVVAAFEAAITPRTKVIEVMHVSFMTGFIAPVRKIVDMARKHGVEVLVDGAHAFAHFPFTRDELGCDYYGTSLHKWCLAPIGTGFLYVRRDRIKHVWSMYAAGPDEDANIRKYEEIGTHPAANHNAIAVALAFHRSIGARRKYERFLYLRDRWAKRLMSESDRVHMFTPMEPGRGGAIGVVGIDGMDMGKLGGWLHEHHHIVSTPMVTPEFAGLRVTPNVYTTVDEIDFFADRMLEAIRKGIS
ncbi:MAG TPA: aminotransferase class V-fold PLP-dependent enzyme [Gemmatimonadaceae bacterium]|nr:aminotransferase class V-fold PLP-dependent enzyme [Gemmatimonadaceae bacterium]